MDDEQIIEAFYKRRTPELIESVGKEEMERLLSYEFSEIDRSFVGFIENYFDLQNLPKDFTIVDIGCYQAVQAHYFREHSLYIGIDDGLPVEYRLRQDNAKYFAEKAEDFIIRHLSEMIERGELDIDKTFAICSAVPSKEAVDACKKTFKYFRISYPGCAPLNKYPDGYNPSNLTHA